MREETSLPRSAPVAVPKFGLPDAGMIFIAVGWGLNFLAIKVSLFEIEPLVFTGLRHIAASAILLTLFAVRGSALNLTRREWVWVIGLGLIGITIHQPLAMYGTDYTTAGNAGLLLSSTPVFVALINHLIGWERLGTRGWFGVGLSFVGMACVIGGDGASFSLRSSTLLGDLICIVGSIAWSLYTVFAQPLLARHDSAKLSAVIMTSGTIPLLAVSTPQFLAQDWGQIGSTAWLGILYSFVVSITLGSLIWNWGVKRLGGARASIYNNLSPAIALAAGALLLGDRLTPLRVIGAAIVIIGIYLARSSTIISNLEPE
jgi:drug/metabolite transporter (DMT)-like permease